MFLESVEEETSTATQNDAVRAAVAAIPAPKTARIRREECRARNADAATADAVVKFTAKERVAYRTRAVCAAARAYVDATVDGTESQRDDLARLLLLEELRGVGGPGDAAGHATARHPAFRSLGKGRRNASDGPAWTAAMHAAVEYYDPPPARVLLSECPTTGEKVATLDFLDPYPGSADAIRAVLPPRWYRAAIVRLLSHAE